MSLFSSTLTKVVLSGLIGAAVGVATIATIKTVKNFAAPSPSREVYSQNSFTTQEKDVSEEQEEFFSNTNKEAASPQEKTSNGERLNATYRCWSFNTSGIGGVCNSPDIIFKSDGTYSMSSEKGTYEIKGDQIILSESKIRGPGTFFEGHQQIYFEYIYNGSQYAMTYLLRENATTSTPSARPTAPLDLTIIYPEDLDGIDWMNVVELVAQNNGKKPTYQALSYAENDRTLKAYFKEAKNEIETGLRYEVFTSNGWEKYSAGFIDVPKSNSLVTLTLDAKSPASSSSQNTSTSEKSSQDQAPVTTKDNSNSQNNETTSEVKSEPALESPDISPAEEPITSSSSTTDSTDNYTSPVTEEEEKLPYEGITCNPLIPKYSQPGCVEEE